eukprot:CAMPEP_0119337486 /NCGR_PEP_ID=MMETSP1333-20130426/94076_1 /TAXON_ID=418940 /ORGANISM="Scyphosphaera apsteinii, Strain RCC1455" /LENGTH=118 /DNA_ID=CAMNT_0007348537 /DNA_START=449 /DNA_END=805 /DNA_ORIENTATION=-
MPSRDPLDQLNPEYAAMVRSRYSRGIAHDNLSALSVRAAFRQTPLGQHRLAGSALCMTDPHQTRRSCGNASAIRTEAGRTDCCDDTGWITCHVNNDSTCCDHSTCRAVRASIRGAWAH